LLGATISIPSGDAESFFFENIGRVLYEIGLYRFSKVGFTLHLDAELTLND
jgi:hypothetical protein